MLKFFLMIDWASRDETIDERMSLSLRKLVQYGNFRVSFVDGRFILSIFTCL